MPSTKFNYSDGLTVAIACNLFHHIDAVNNTFYIILHVGKVTFLVTFFQSAASQSWAVPSNELGLFSEMRLPLLPCIVLLGKFRGPQNDDDSVTVPQTVYDFAVFMLFFPSHCRWSSFSDCDSLKL